MLLSWVLGLCLPGRAAASPLFETLGATLGQGGFNARVSSPGAPSAYYNPALLPRAKQGLDLGWVFLHDSIGITLNARSPSVDVPVSGVGRFGTGNPQPPLPTDWLEHGCDPATGGACSSPLEPHPRQGVSGSGNTRVYQSVGFVTPLLGKYLTAGLYTLIPYGAFTTGHAYFVDEREQYFTNSLYPELYGDRLDAISLALGAGSQLTDQLAIGIAFTLNLANQANAATYVGNSADIPGTLLLSTDIGVYVGVAPHLGVTYTPRDDLSFSATVHSPQKMEIETSFGTFLPNGDLQIATRKSTHAFVPWTVGFGGQYDFIETASQVWGITGNGVFARTSRYVNRQSERPDPDFAWSDQFSGSLGVRHTFADRLRSYLDATYVPSPVPAQTGRENYVDNDRLGLALGTEVEVPIRRWDVALKFGINGQVQFLFARSQQKLDPRAPQFSDGTYSQLVHDEWADDTTDVATGKPIPEAEGLQTNNPGWPGFSSRGILGGGTVSITLLY